MSLHLELRQVVTMSVLKMSWLQATNLSLPMTWMRQSLKNEARHPREESNFKTSTKMPSSILSP
jgi:hypothetical protein